MKLLSRQTENAYEWTNKVLASVPSEEWDVTPSNIETNVTWQTGHLIMSIYYHSIMVIAGHQADIVQVVPLKDYGSLFTKGEPKMVRGKVAPHILMEQFHTVQQKSIEIIDSLSENDLDDALVPTNIPHPIAKNKYEALDWNIKHVMWHCGQIGILKRAIHERYDFGLKF